MRFLSSRPGQRPWWENCVSMKGCVKILVETVSFLVILLGASGRAAEEPRVLTHVAEIRGLSGEEAAAVDKIDLSKLY